MLGQSGHLLTSSYNIRCSVKSSHEQPDAVKLHCSTHWLYIHTGHIHPGHKLLKEYFLLEIIVW